MGWGKRLPCASMGRLRLRNLAANKLERINALCGGCIQAEHGPCWPLCHGDTQDHVPGGRRVATPSHQLQGSSTGSSGAMGIPLPSWCCAFCNGFCPLCHGVCSRESIFWVFMCYFSFFGMQHALTHRLLSSSWEKIFRISGVTAQFNLVFSLFTVYTFIQVFYLT